MKDFIKNLTGQLEIDYKNLYSNLAYTKSDHWDYEKEWRYVVIRPTIKNNLYDMNRLHPEEIDKIYLGCRISEQNRDEILKLLIGKLKHVKVAIASRSKTRFGRLSWDTVSSTITGGCLNPSKGRFLHPVKNRCITAREAALLQTFPIDYKFPTDIPRVELALLIGNALPPEFSRIQAKNIFHHIEQSYG